MTGRTLRIYINYFQNSKHVKVEVSYIDKLNIRQE